jgi:WD40 repeat protein
LNKESPTLDLSNDCIRFITGCFEVINTSAPHIYHSALLSSPKESIVRTLYGSHVSPLVRVVQGAQISWDLSVATREFPLAIEAAVWSPCGRFVGVAWDTRNSVVVLDAVTLGPLYTMHSLEDITHPTDLVFSPHGSLLSSYFENGKCIVSWDLQTGGLISSIWTKTKFTSMSYSRCGVMLGGLSIEPAIIIYNVLSGTHLFSHLVHQSVAKPIWTCGEYLQFATVELGSITLQQIGFTSNNGPIKVGSLPTPDNFSPDKLALLPGISRLAFIIEGKVVVWDPQYHKVLLDSMDVKNPIDMSFSPDGCFFMCGTGGPEFYLWKESSHGYLPHQKLVASTSKTKPDISPDGESIISPNGESIISPDGKSIISFGGPNLQLWQTKTPTSFTEASPGTREFIVGFSPDESMLAITKWLSKTVTILSLKSGNTQLVIEMDTEIYGMRIMGDKVIIVGNGKICTWGLPSGDNALVAENNIDNSIQTTPFKPLSPSTQRRASISPDLNYIALTDFENGGDISIYSIHTGEELVFASNAWWLPGFTSGGGEVWCAASDGMMEWWTIIKGEGSDVIRLEQKPGEPPGDLFWQSASGYQTTVDGWVLNSSRKRLLRLPHHWWPNYVVGKHWSGNFLVLWNGELQEPVILELEV